MTFQPINKTEEAKKKATPAGRPVHTFGAQSSLNSSSSSYSAFSAAVAAADSSRWANPHCPYAPPGYPFEADAAIVVGPGPVNRRAAAPAAPAFVRSSFAAPAASAANSFSPFVRASPTAFPSASAAAAAPTTTSPPLFFPSASEFERQQIDNGRVASAPSPPLLASSSSPSSPLFERPEDVQEYLPGSGAFGSAAAYNYGDEENFSASDDESEMEQHSLVSQNGFEDENGRSVASAGSGHSGHQSPSPAPAPVTYADDCSSSDLPTATAPLHWPAFCAALRTATNAWFQTSAIVALGDRGVITGGDVLLALYGMPPSSSSSSSSILAASPASPQWGPVLWLEFCDALASDPRGSWRRKVARALYDGKLLIRADYDQVVRGRRGSSWGLVRAYDV